jgi:hypothetical protein
MKRRQYLGLILFLSLLTTAFAAGCNIPSLAYFLAPGADTKDPQFKVASADKDKEVRVMILASTGLETRPEFLRVDRELSRLLAVELQKGFKENKEKVTVVPCSQVDKHRDEHPNWHAVPAADIGKYFDANYVIQLTINNVTLYEPGSARQLFRGRAAITIEVADVSKPSEGPVYEEEYTIEFPRAKGPIAVDGSNPAQFRQLFLSKMARELAWRFTAHSVDEDMKLD